MEVPVVVRVDDDVIEEIADIMGVSVDEVRDRIAEELREFAEFWANLVYRRFVDLISSGEEVDISKWRDEIFRLGLDVMRGRYEGG